MTSLADYNQNRRCPCGARVKNINVSGRCHLCARGDRRDHRLGDLLTMDATLRLLAAMAAQARRAGEGMGWLLL